MTHAEAIAAVERLGARAFRAVELSAGTADTSKWVPGHLLVAAHGLADGSHAVGVHRPWPRLAAGLKRVHSLWAVARGGAS